MPIKINFTTFTDPLVAWANKQALNQFFNDITVPDATTLSKGVVTQLPNILNGGSIALTYVNLNVVDEHNNVVTTQVPDRASFLALYNSYISFILLAKAGGLILPDP